MVIFSLVKFIFRKDHHNNSCNDPVDREGKLLDFHSYDWTPKTDTFSSMVLKNSFSVYILDVVTYSYQVFKY